VSPRLVWGRPGDDGSDIRPNFAPELQAASACSDNSLKSLARPTGNVGVDEKCLDFGIDLGSPVGIEYYDQAPFKFNGKIEEAHVQYLGASAQLQQEKLQTDGAIPSQD
jgi:hypothetical protein